MPQTTQPGQDIADPGLDPSIAAPILATELGAIGRPALLGSVAGFNTIDRTAPTINSITLPVLDSDPYIINCYTTPLVEEVLISCRDGASRRIDAYNTSEGFIHPFAGRSTITGSGTLADPFIITVYRRGRWPTGLELSIQTKIVDANGNEFVSTSLVTIALVT